MLHALVVTTLVALTCGCGAGAPPRLEVTGGLSGESATTPARLRAGDTARARYEIGNAGGRDLLLHGLLLDCGCRLASALPDALAPGEATAITVLCRAPQLAGESVRELRLLSSDPEQPEVRLRVSMSVGGGGAEPGALYFGYVPVGGSAARELAVGPTTLGSGARGGDARARSSVGAAVDAGQRGSAGATGEAQRPPVPADPAITVESLPPRADGRHAYRVRFTPRAAGPLHTALDLGPERGTVAVSGVGFRSVLAFPAEVTLPNAATANGPPAIALKNLAEEPLEITRVDYPPGLTGDLQGLAPGREFRLALRARGPGGPRGEGGQGGAAIRLHTSAPDEPVVIIPVLYADGA